MNEVKSNFEALLKKSLDTSSIEIFNKLKETANELSLIGGIASQDLQFLNNIGQILGLQKSEINLDVRTLSVPLTDEVRRSICEKVSISSFSRIWLVEIAIDKKSSLHSEARKLLLSKSLTELCEIVNESCIAFIGSKRWATPKALDKELKLRAAIIPKSWTVFEFPGILRVAHELSEIRMIEPCGNWIANLLTPKKAVEVGQQIEKKEFDKILALLKLFSRTALIQKNARGLLSLLVTNSDDNLESLPDSIWEGVDADTLMVFLTGIRGPRSVLISGAAQENVLLPALVKKFSSNGKAWEYLKIISEFPELKIPELFTLVVDKRDRPSREASAIIDFVDSFAAERIQSEIHRTSREFEAQLNTQRRKFEEEETNLRRKLEGLSANFASLEDRLRESMGANHDAHQSEIRQGRLDILRELIKHLESLRLICPLLEGISSTAEELVRSVELTLTHFSVEIVGEAGSITTYNSELYEYIGVIESQKFRILSPAYLIDGVGGEKLVLKKGVCSPI